MGGTSSEREVSLASGKAVAAGLARALIHAFHLKRNLQRGA
jgi:D-alanine-D-alanine ligase-like ATP-grasp enzyme